MKLRQLLSNLTSVKGLTSEEKGFQTSTFYERKMKMSLIIFFCRSRRILKLFIESNSPCKSFSRIELWTNLSLISGEWVFIKQLLNIVHIIKCFISILAFCDARRKQKNAKRSRPFRAELSWLRSKTIKSSISVDFTDAEVCSQVSYNMGTFKIST